MIEPYTIRDGSYVFANLNPRDYDELSCQHRRFDPALLAAMVEHTGPWAYIARHDGVPAAVFGAAVLSATTVSAWLAGTKRARRLIPEITRFVDGPLRRDLKRHGYVWAEARSIVGYDAVHGWLERLGGVPVADLPGYGTAGEDFILFRAEL